MAASAHLLIEPVAGFRLFRLAEDGEPRLRGLVAAADWPARPDAEFAARCRPDAIGWPQFVHPHPHDAPHRLCRCGIYAYEDLGRALEGMQPGLVVGLVAAYGTVIPHDDGVRAGRAVLCALHDPMDRTRALAVAERTGAVWARRADELRGLALEFAGALPASARRDSDGPLPR